MPDETRQEKGWKDKRKLPQSNHPTVGAASDSHKKVVDALNEVDPQRISCVLKNMHTEFEKIRSLLSTSMSSGIGFSGGSGGTAQPSRGLKNTLSDALTGALSILVKKYSYAEVIDLFVSAYNGSDYDVMSDDYSEIVKSAFTSFYMTVVLYGEKNIPISIIPPVVRGTKTPPNIYTSVPDLYVRQYFTPENDPYPGYIQWKGTDGTIIYTIRTDNDNPFPTAQDHIYSISEQGLAKEIEKYLKDSALKFTVTIFYNLLIYYCSLMEDVASESNAGKNSNKFSGDLTQLLGAVLGNLVSTAQTAHIPPSVLDKGKMNNIISKTTKMQGRLNNVIKPALKAAVQESPGNISNIISGLNLGGSTSFLTSSLSNLRSLTGNPDTNKTNNLSDEQLLRYASILETNKDAEVKVLLSAIDAIT